jgi:ketosteroid isomerase-like protein
MTSPTILPVIAAIILLAPASRAQRTDTTRTIAELLAADSTLARATQSEGAAAFLDRLEADAAVLFPGQPILSGAAGARSAYLARYADPSVHSWTPLHAVASMDGRFGCTVGVTRFWSASDTTRAEHRGMYTTCWRQASDRSWRIVGHQRNDGPAVAADTKVPLMQPAPHSAVSAAGSDPRRAAQDADAAFAALGAEPAGPGPAFAKYAASDAMLLGAAEVPRGPTEIAAGFAQYPSTRVITWEPARDFGAGSGGLAFTVGHSTNGPRAGQTKAGPTSHGKYLTVWRQEPDGRWLYVFDLGSPRP